MKYSLPVIMLICLTSTIVIEVIVSLFLKVRKGKDIANIILVNILTNPLVVTIPFYMNISYGLFSRNVTLLIMEVLVVLVEGLIYKKYISYKKTNPYLLSLIINFSSYVIGNLINYIIY